MPERRKREKVVAEITLAHLTQIAQETGRALTQQEGIEFLNQNGHAYAMWKKMMQAGEEYIKTALNQQAPVAVTRTGSHRRMVI